MRLKSLIDTRMSYYNYANDILVEFEDDNLKATVFKEDDARKALGKCKVSSWCVMNDKKMYVVLERE